MVEFVCDFDLIYERIIDYFLIILTILIDYGS